MKLEQPDATGSRQVRIYTSDSEPEPRGELEWFFALPAGEGAGIYEVTITRDGRIQGVSEEGARLDARQDGDKVRGTLTTPSGQRFDYQVSDLTRSLSYPRRGNRPDSYLAVAAPRGRFFFGRNGDVRGGSTGTNIIGLDKAC